MSSITKPEKRPAPPEAGGNWRAPMVWSFAVILGTFGIGGGWAAYAPLDSAISAPGIVFAAKSRQTIQHLEGGIISEILVKDGDLVEQGALLFRLDSTMARGNVETLQILLTATMIKEARLIAERDKLPEIVFPEEIRRDLKNEMIAQAIGDEQRAFQQRRDVIKSQVDVLESRIQQARAEMTGLDAEAVANREQLIFIDKELPGLRSLLLKQLVPLTRVTALERDRSRIEGALARSAADRMKSEVTISESRLQMSQVESQFQQTLAGEIVDTRRQIADTRERLNVARDTLRRVDVRSPEAGVAQSRRFATVGAVVRPGDPLVDIAPVERDLVIKAQVSPNDIDVIKTGQRAEIRFANFKATEVPVMFGTVISTSNDRITEQGREAYFAVDVVAEADKLAPDVRARIRPGQNAEVIMRTGERSALRYILQPIEDRLRNALHEK